jgi:hypothetical protein
MNERRSLVLAVFAFGLTACGHTDVNTVVFRPNMPPKAQGVPLYLAAQASPSVAQDIALVQAVGYGNEASPEDVTQALSARGASLGCDAIVRVQIHVGNTRAHASGVCVKTHAGAPAPTL